MASFGKDTAGQSGAPGSDHLRDGYCNAADDGASSDKKREAAMLFSVAEGHLEDEDPEEALTSAGDALNVFRELEDMKGVADATRLIIHAYRKMADAARLGDDFKESSDRFRQATEIAEEELERFHAAGEKRGEAAMQLAIAELNVDRVGGWRFSDYKTLDEALDNAEDALEIFKELEDQQMEVSSLFTLSKIYVQKNNFPFAKRAAQESLDLYKKLGDTKGEVRAWENLAFVWAGDFCYEDAVRWARKGLKRAQETGQRRNEAKLLYSIGRWSLQKGDPQSALPAAQQALSIVQETSTAKELEMVIFGVAAESYLQIGARKKAVQFCQEQVETARQAGEPRVLVESLLPLAYMLEQEKNHDEALLTGQEAATICREQNFRRLESKALEDMAYVYIGLVDFENAKRCAKEAVDILRDLELQEQECKGRMFIQAKINVLAKDYENAVRAAKEGERLARDIGDNRLEGQAALAVCSCKSMAGHIDEAIKAGELAADIFKDIGGNWRLDEGKAYQALAEVHLASGDLSNALRASKQSEYLLQDFGDKRRLATMKHTTCGILQAAGDFSEAARVAMEALKIHRSTDCITDTITSLMIAIHANVQVLTRDEETSSRRVFASHCERTIRLAKEAISLAIKSGDTGSEASGFCWCGYLHLLAGRGQEAKLAVEQANTRFAEANDVFGQAWAHAVLGQAQIHLRDTPGGIKTLNQGLAFAREAGDDSMIDQIEEILQAYAGKPASGAQAAQPTMIEVPGEVEGPPPSAVSVAGGGGEELFKPPDPSMVKHFIIGLVANMTGSQDEIEADVPLMESGIDSLASVELRTQLQKEFRVNLPSTVMFNYPTISGMTELLVEECTQKKIAWSV